MSSVTTGYLPEKLRQLGPTVSGEFFSFSRRRYMKSGEAPKNPFEKVRDFAQEKAAEVKAGRGGKGRKGGADIFCFVFYLIKHVYLFLLRSILPIFAYCGLVVEIQPLNCYNLNCCSPSNVESWHFDCDLLLCRFLVRDL